MRNVHPTFGARAQRLLTLVSGLAVIAIMYGSLPGYALETREFADDFSQKNSYANSSGTHPWAGSWVEYDDVGGATDGAIFVDDEEACPLKYCLVLGPGADPYASVTRSFDSTGATNLVMSYSYQRTVDDFGPGKGTPGVVRLLASNGGDFVLIRMHEFSTSDPSPLNVTVDLTSYASPTSAIRFELVGGSFESLIEIDNVKITAHGEPPPPTTSTTASTSTTTASTTTTPTPTTISPTTTTKPPKATTTTTTKPPKATTTTTTKPPKATTTTTTKPPKATTTTVLVPITPQPRSSTSSPATSGPGSTALPQGPLGPEEIPVISISRERATEIKESIVLAASENPPPPPGDSHQGPGLAPIEGLTVSFSTATETLRSRFLASVLIGIGMAAALVFGIDDRKQVDPNEADTLLDRLKG